MRTEQTIILSVQTACLPPTKEEVYVFVVVSNSKATTSNLKAKAKSKAWTFEAKG